MKKFFLLTLMFLMIICAACGNKKSAEQPASAEPEKIDAVLVAGSFWVTESENMPYLNDAINRNDVEYMKQLMLEGKVFFVDHDTKVIRFGVAADKNNSLIQFKEGRYTNKTGCAYANNVIAEADFPAYLEAQRQKKITQIKESLTSTEKYADVIAAGNLEEIERLSLYCLDKTNELKKFRLEQKDDILEQAELAINIIFTRDQALRDYKYFIEYSQKVEQEKQGTKNFRAYIRMKDDYESDIYKHSQKAEQLRQEFKAKYGY